MAKPMGNGLPLAVVITRRELVEGFLRTERYFNTFGGNQVVAAAGIAVFDVLRDEGLQENALQVGAYLRDRLAKLMEKDERIGDVRGTGLFVGVEIVRDRASQAPAPRGRARDHRGAAAAGCPRRHHRRRPQPAQDPAADGLLQGQCRQVGRSAGADA
jgi:4-aminobutyrate aminotransferase-like enzyme